MFRVRKSYRGTYTFEANEFKPHGFAPTIRRNYEWGKKNKSNRVNRANKNVTYLHFPDSSVLVYGLGHCIEIRADYALSA